MSITHHLDGATLMSFAAGSLPEALAAVAAAHVAACPDCAAEVRGLERVGARLFETLPPAALDRPPPPAASAPGIRGPARIPAAFMGQNFDRVRWRWLAFGIWQSRLPLSRAGKGSLRLLKVSPGQSIPEHGHGGAELTLVLRGSYSDATGCYGEGDVADLDEDIAHSPVAGRETGCVCLIATETPARFKGLVPRLIQPFTRL